MKPISRFISQNRQCVEACIPRLLKLRHYAPMTRTNAAQCIGFFAKKTFTPSSRDRHCVP
jgi:hypothetical protein